MTDKESQKAEAQAIPPAGLGLPAAAPTAAGSPSREELQKALEALERNICFSAYSASEPLSIRFDFACAEDRIAAANALDDAFAALASKPLPSISDGDPTLAVRRSLDHLALPPAKSLPPALWRCVNCKAELPGRSDGACPERCPECRFSQFAEIAQPKPLPQTDDVLVTELAAAIKATPRLVLGDSAENLARALLKRTPALSAQSPPPPSSGEAEAVARAMEAMRMAAQRLSAEGQLKSETDEEAQLRAKMESIAADLFLIIANGGDDD